MPPRKARTYGTKKSVTTDSAAKIFGKPRQSASPQKLKTRSQSVIESEAESEREAPPLSRRQKSTSPHKYQTRSQSVLEDDSESDTETLPSAPKAEPKSNSYPIVEIRLNGEPKSKPKSDPPSVDDLADQFSHARIDNETSDSEENCIVVDTSVTTPANSESEIDLSVLSPLIDAYKRDSDIDLEIQDWNEILPEDCTMVKIAEASFSEVYRITTETATSIIKILPLKVSYDTDSIERTYAQEIQDVVPEIRIMNALTVIPGFVTFKGAYLAMGPLSKTFIDAWAEYHSVYDASEFEDPALYGKNATFLAIELGDAGDVLDEVEVWNLDQVWDIFLGVVVALTRAEALYEFEHRDLHENNICIYQHPVLPSKPPKKNDRHTPRFGQSGIEITIIDYGLSRATLNPDEKSFKDLETDLEIFHGTDGHKQFDSYRRMRNHLFTGLPVLQKASWHTPASRELNDGHTWEEYIPYTNVIWLYYLWRYLEQQVRRNGEGWEWEVLSEQTKGLRQRFDYRGKKFEGKFQSAKEVLDFCLESGWIDVEQIVEIDSEGSFFG